MRDDISDEDEFPPLKLRTTYRHEDEGNEDIATGLDDNYSSSSDVFDYDGSIKTCQEATNLNIKSIIGTMDDSVATSDENYNTYEHREWESHPEVSPPDRL